MMNGSHSDKDKIREATPILQ